MSEAVKMRAIDGPRAGEWFTVPRGFHFPLAVPPPMEPISYTAKDMSVFVPPPLPVFYWPWQKARETVLTVTDRKAPRELLERWFPELFRSDLT